MRVGGLWSILGLGLELEERTRSIISASRAVGSSLGPYRTQRRPPLAEQGSQQGPRLRCGGWSALRRLATRYGYAVGKHQDFDMREFGLGVPCQ